MSAATPGMAVPLDFRADLVAIESIGAVPTILEVVCRTTGMGFAAVARVTEDRWIACQVRDEIEFGLKPGGELAVETTICHEIRRDRTAVVINHVAEDAVYCGHPTPARYGFQSYISMPIVLPDGSFFGTLCAIDPKPARLDTPETIGMFKMFAELIAFHLDALTRLSNRTAERDRAWRLSQDLLVVADGAVTFEAVNAAWTVLLGWDERDLIGSGFQALSHPDDLAGTLDAFAGLVRAPLAQPFEYRLRHKDGSCRWFAWTGAFENGKVFANGRDTTVHHEQAQVLARVEDALRQSQKLEVIGQLTGGVAHDFNNLLTVIRSSTDLLMRPDLPEERRLRYMTAISDTVDRAAKLTGQLLAFARRQALKPEVFEIGCQLRALADMLDTITGARIDVVTDLPEQPCYVRADLSQFETALVNIAVNARDAMGGEGTLRLRLVAGDGMPAIRGHAGGQGVFAAVSLADTGHGMSSDRLSRIFEPFFTTKEVGKGTGLGLSQVIGFAKQSGGDVEVASMVGLGTTFTLYLPAVEAPGVEVKRRRSLDMAVGGEGLRILMVEDNLEIGRFSSQLLDDLAHTVVWAKNAVEALQQLAGKDQRFDVVVSDVVMPGMSGFDLATEVRRLYPGLPVVLTSGYSHILAQNDDHGFDLLHKPYSIDQLTRALAKAMPQG